MSFILEYVSDINDNLNDFYATVVVILQSK
jgi:hypothetical protein